MQGLSQAQIDELARAGRKALHAERSEAQTRMANQNTARLLNDDAVFVLRGRRLKFRPLPFEDGLKLMELGAIIGEIRQQMEQGRGSDLPSVFRVYQMALEEVVRMAHMLMRPRFIPAWLWRWHPTKFPDLTYSEALELLRFCARCQTMSPVPVVRTR